MSTNTTVPWGTLEQWSAIAFVVAAVLFLVNTLLEGLGRYTALMGDPGFLNAALYLSALVISLVGLLGFYSSLSDRVPRLARLSAAVVAVAGLGLVTLLTWATGTVLLDRPMPPGVLLILNLLTIVLGFALFTGASLWTGLPSRTVGLLLGVFVVAWIGSLMLLLAVFDAAPDWLIVALNGITFVVFVGIGYDLRTGPAPTDRRNLAKDSTAK